MPGDKHVPDPGFNLNTPHAGGFISASEYRKLKGVVRDVVREEFSYEHQSKVRIFRLTDPTNPTNRGKQTGYAQHWNADDAVWKDETDDEKTNISSALAMAMENEGITPSFFHRQSGLWVPLSLADGLWCKTPSGGISARSGTTIGGPEDCVMYWDDGDLGSTATLTKITLPDSSDWELPIYNAAAGSSGAVAGDEYVLTWRSMSGKRYVVIESC